MKVWQKAFRHLAVNFSDKGLEALLTALNDNDPRLIQGVTTTPPPLMCTQDWPVEGCCATCFPFWQGDDLDTVGEVEKAFARACFECDQAMGEPGGVRYFLTWFDETPRDHMRQELAAEVKSILSERMLS